MPADFPDKLYICTDTLTLYLVNNWEGLVLICIILTCVSIGICFISITENYKYSKLVASIAALIAISIITTIIIVPPKELLVNKVINKIMIINNIPNKYFSVVRGILEEQKILHTTEEVAFRVAKFRLKNTPALVPLIEVEENIMYEKFK